MRARGLFVLTLVAAVAGACSGGGAASIAAPTIGPGGSGAPPSLGLVSAAPSIGLPSIGGGGLLHASLRPTGAKLRIANLYSSAPGQPAAIDIYADFNAQAGPLLVSVPYGTVTDWFDPGALDEDGDAQWSFYPQGKTADDDQIGSQSETLKGTEQITMFIGVADDTSKNAAGQPNAQWKAIYENGTVFPLPSAEPGKAVVMAEGVGLPAVPGSKETFIYVAVDGACLPSVDQGPDGGAQPWGPHSQQAYVAPAGSHDLAIHLPGANGGPDCKAKSELDAAHYDLAPGERGWLAFYSPDDKVLKALFVKAGP